jgi:hypothetical protein
VHYALTCKESEIDGVHGYRFILEKDKLTKSFKMFDIKPGEKSVSILQNELIYALKMLNQFSLGKDSVKLYQILNNISQGGKSLTAEEKEILDKFIKNTYQGYGFESKSLENYLDTLLKKMETSKENQDLKLIKDSIVAIRTISKEKSKEIVDKINLIAAEFLSNAYSDIYLKSDSEIEIGVLSAKQSAKVFLKKYINPQDTSKNKMKFISELKLKKPDSIKIDNVEIKFESEQIAGIKVTGTPLWIDTTKARNKNILEFQNRIPIPYSTKADVSNDRNSKIWKSRLFDIKDPFYINLGDVIFNDYKLVNHTEDYSPMDQVLIIKPKERGKVIKKEAVTNLLDAAVFTDLVGFNGSQPNGLIQTEFWRRFYLNRKVSRFIPSYNYCGYFNSIKPKITFSKLESNNKVLELEINDSSQLYVNTIDIFKHTSWSSGGEVNIGFLGLPCFQSMLYLNFGMDILNVPMRLPDVDSTASFHDIKPDDNGEFNKSFISLYPELCWTISPHSKFQIAYSIKYHWLINYSNDFVLVYDSERFLTNDGSAKRSQNIISFKFLATLILSNKANGQIFFRSYYNLIPQNHSQNYFQAQLGYSFNIFDRKAEPPPLKPFEGL